MTGITITAVWDGKEFVPDQVFVDDCKAIDRKRQVTITIEQPRHPEFHRWFFAMLKAVCDSGAFDGDPEDLLRFIKLGIGYGDWYPLKGGRPAFVPRSISFAKCDELKFRRFVWFAARFLAERLGVNVDAVFDEADRIAGPVEQRQIADARRAA